MAINTTKSDERTVEAINSQVILRLFRYLKPHKTEVVIVLLLMGVKIFVDLINPYFLKEGIDRFIARGDIQGFLVFGVVMIGLNAIAMVSARKRMEMMSATTHRILMTIRQELFNHIQTLSFQFFDSRPIGKILARIIGDVNSLNNLFTNSVTSLIPGFVTMLAVITIMMSLNYRLALMALITLPFLMISMFLVQTISRRRWQLFRKKGSNMNAFTHEDFSGIRVVQSTVAEEKTRKMFRDLSSEYRKAFVDAVKINDLFWALVEISWGAGMVIVLWYGVKLLNERAITVGLLVAFTGYISRFWRPVVDMSSFYNTLITNMAGAERIFEIMDTPPDLADSSEAKPLPMIHGLVEFDNVTFEYEPGKPALKNVSFRVNPGETIALVGHTGAGKTTIVNLISRFFDPTFGRVLIDGVDIKEVTLESLRSQMGIMSQETFLFSDSIKENIRYGKLMATDAEIEEAAKAVHAHEFICKLENGYETKVNERGSRLSTGQRQLIALARALLADPRILILDEATASVDTHTEKLIQQGIQRLLKGRTSFVIAHRLSTIQNADRIMVVENGEIAECGTHQELMAKKGIYYQMFMAQFKFWQAKGVG